MSRYDRSDIQVEGQSNLEYFYGERERLIAVHRVLARAQKNMSLAEYKTFICALSKIQFTEIMRNTTVVMDVKEVANNIGINPDPDHLSHEVNKAINQLPEHSAIKLSNEDKRKYNNFVLITDANVDNSKVIISFHEKSTKYFSGLTSEYITMWNADIYGMSSLRSVKFYEFLRQITDTRRRNNNVLLGVKALKEMFDIPKDGKGSYMRNSGGFDRVNFEKKVIEPLCEDLKNCRMIQLLVQSDGKCYEKVKSGNRVDGYRFHWVFTSRPGIATAGEVKELQERVDQDPKVLKIAKDVAKGKKKAAEKTNFNNFEQRDYPSEHYKALEEKMSK